MLFTIIRDFFVHHVWGGWDSENVNFLCKIGSKPNGEIIANLNTQIETGFLNNEGLPVTLCLGDWLSTTSTVITMIVMLICIAYFIRWIFKVSSNMILLR